MKPWIKLTASIAGLLAFIAAAISIIIYSQSLENAPPPAVEIDANAADIEFAQLMIPHHLQAVEMADLALMNTDNLELLKIAREIKVEQKAEVQQLQDWLYDWNTVPLPPMDHSAHGDMPGMEGMLSDHEIKKLGEARDAEFDQLFLNYMIEHHRGAIEMALDVLNEGQNADLAEFAEQVIKTQKSEIAAMEQLQKT